MIMQFINLFGAAILLTILFVLIVGFSTGTITVKYNDAATQSKGDQS